MSLFRCESVYIRSRSSPTNLQDTQPIYSVCVSPSAQRLILFTASLSLRIYDLFSAFNGGKSIHPIRVIGRAHDAPVHVCLVDPTSTYLASGSADGIVKVWDIFRGYVTHVFKGHGGVVSALRFNFPQHPASVNQERKVQLITASVDTRIRVFNLTPSSKHSGALKPDVVLEGHSSVPRGLDVSQDGKWLLSGGRDSVVLIWDLSHSYETKEVGTKRKLPTLVKTVPILERVEAMGLIQLDDDIYGSERSPDRILFFTGGQHGIVKIWDGREGNVLFTLGEQHGDVSDDQEEQQQIVNAMYVSAYDVVSIH
jgi:U3 small nucleolar RNA-associated protein 13